MLQIIGWLGCVYLIVKALSISASKEYRGDDGNMTSAAVLTVIVAWFAAIGFALWFLAQGQSANELMSVTNGATESTYGEAIGPAYDETVPVDPAPAEF